MSLFGTIGDFLSGGNQSAAAAAQQQAVDAMSGLQTPDVDDMVVKLDKLVQQGVITPEQAQVYLQGSSEMAGISTDPALRDAQYNALSSLQDISNQGGMTAVDKANLAKIATSEAAKSRGAREAIIQQMEARGGGNSGMNVLAQLQNAQEAAGRQNQRDLDVAGQAQSRALAALQSAGTLGSQMQQNSFNQQAQQANAQDAINKFNTANMGQVNQANVAANNAAQTANLASKQSIADKNVDLMNKQQQYNKQLAQQNFDNQYKKAGGTASTLQNQAGQFNTTGDNITNMVGSALDVGGKAAAAISDERLKKDIADFDASAFLDSLTPSKYNYKNPAKHGEGGQVGVMAQEVEKTVPQMVKEGPDGKYLDYNKAGGPIFASMADLHDRLKQLEEDKE